MIFCRRNLFLVARRLLTDERRRIEATKTYILNHLDQQLTLSYLAKLSFMTEKQFGDGFQKLFGSKVIHYIHEVRLGFAYFLLQHTDKPIKEIARLSGYGYTKNFMNAFRKRFKRTAGSVR